MAFEEQNIRRQMCARVILVFALGLLVCAIWLVLSAENNNQTYLILVIIALFCCVAFMGGLFFM